MAASRRTTKPKPRAKQRTPRAVARDNICLVMSREAALALQMSIESGDAFEDNERVATLLDAIFDELEEQLTADA
jgi:hypothetical protein